MTDRIKKESSALADGFRLHYFPNIPVDEPADDGGRRVSNSEFQRSLFTDLDLDPGCPDEPSAPETAATPEADQKPSIEELKESAFQKGFVEGKNVGFASGSKKAQAAVVSLQRSLEQLQRIRSDMQREIEREVTHLALAIAKKVVCHEVKTRQETVTCVAREALRRVDNPGKVKIKLNADDLRFLKDTQPRFPHLLQNIDHVRFEADDSIESGGCVIETDRGDIDARIEKQFEALEEAFRAQLDQPGQEAPKHDGIDLQSG